MKINKEQKDILISIVEKTIDDMDMDESMEFGEDIRIILEEVKKLEVEK